MSTPSASDWCQSLRRVVSAVVSRAVRRHPVGSAVAQPAPRRLGRMSSTDPTGTNVAPAPTSSTAPGGVEVRLVRDDEHEAVGALARQAYAGDFVLSPDYLAEIESVA